jgi:riboflavin synthase
MFTGIIEQMAVVMDIHPAKDNKEFLMQSALKAELKVDQSVSHDGVCLTVTRIEEEGYWVTAVRETLEKSNLSDWKKGRKVNVERSMKLGGRLDGHIVQGHVDQVAAVVDIEDQGGSWMFRFEYQDDAGKFLCVEKGSITVNGVSLTCFDVEKGAFSVAVIPYTYKHTGFSALTLGAKVNLEFDVIGKYVQRIMGADL